MFSLFCFTRKNTHSFAVRRNFTHEVNFTVADNFTCPKGKLRYLRMSVFHHTSVAEHLPFGVCNFVFIVPHSLEFILCKGNKHKD